MSVVITREDLKAYAEVDYVIKHMNERYISKLPEHLVEFFETIKDPDYEVYVSPYKPLQEQGLSKYALEIIALLHVKYWCEDPFRREELLQKMKENQDKFETQMEEKFNSDKLFENEETPKKEATKKDFVVKTAYSEYMEENPDIQDYTDVKDEEVTQDLPQNVAIKVSIFKKIKNFVSNIFKKNTD